MSMQFLPPPITKCWIEPSLMCYALLCDCGILSTVKPALSDRAWAEKKWSLNRGGLLIEVKMNGRATIGT